MTALSGKVALVTGASRGIGAAIAKRLAADGASVAITYSNSADAAVKLVKDIEGTGGKAIAIQADATDAKAVTAAVETTVATFGRLDVLVNNAGTAIPKPFEETTLDEMDRVININLRGVFIATQAALKQMHDGGRVITIGSCVGERMMTPGLVAYAATKGAVKMFTQGLSREVGATRHHGQHYPARSYRYRFEPRCWRVGSATDRQYRAQALRPCRGHRCDGGVRRRSGGGLHHGRQPDRRWRNQRLRGTPWPRCQVRLLSSPLRHLPAPFPSHDTLRAIAGA